MFYNEQFIDSLSEDPSTAIKTICDKYFKQNELTKQKYDLATEACALLSAYSEAHSLGLELPSLKGSPLEDVSAVQIYLGKLRTETDGQIHQDLFSQHKNRFDTKFGTIFHYEFSEGDLKRIQELINELRELISATKELKEEHKRRILNKLERFQSELHKRVSDLDRFWGFFINGSIVLGMMGENAKPMVDLIKDILGIIWPAQTRAYELPSSLPFKLLGQSEDD